MTSPLLRSGQFDDFAPMFEVRNDFESFWNFSTSVFCEYFSYLSVNSLDLRVVNGLLIGLFQFFLKDVLPFLLRLVAR